MLSGKRSRISLLILPLCLLLIAGASESEPEERDDSFGRNDDDVVVVRAGTSRRSVEKGAEEGTTSDGCTWTVYVSDDLDQPIFQNGVELVDDSSPIHVDDPAYGRPRLFSETGRWFQAVGCNDLAVSGIYAEGDTVSLPELVGEAYNALDPPDPTGFGTSPTDNGADRFPVVRIPTWFWVEEPYRTTTFSARAAFPDTGPVRVWADAFALADDSEWFPGDGTGPVECPGLGVEWVSGMPEDAADCTHTYLRSSVFEPGDAYDVVGRVWFSTWWETSVIGAPSGPLAPISRYSVPVPLRVGEIQAVGS